MERSGLFIILSYLLMAPNHSTANITGHNDTEMTPLERFVALKNDRYSEYLSPPRPRNNGPVAVNVSAHINYLADINEVDQEYTMEIYLYQYWTDLRLQFAEYIPGVDSIPIADDYYEDIWRPDVYVSNGKIESGHEVTRPNRMFRLYADGSIIYSIRLTLTLSCEMELAKFPMDRQHCALFFESYRYKTSEMTLSWNLGNPIKMVPQRLAMYETSGDPVQSLCDELVFTTGTYPCLRVDFQFKRRLGFYLTQVYIPSVLIVCTSWISFWLDPESVPGRVSIGIITILAMTSRMSSTASAAKVSYLKAMDVWITGCMSFLFVGVVEFAVVNTLVRRSCVKREVSYKDIQSEKTMDEPQLRSPSFDHPGCSQRRHSTPTDPRINLVSKDFQRQDEPGIPDEVTLAASDVSSETEVDSCSRQYYLKTALTVDYFSRVFFPTAFVIFIIAYWVYYT